MASEKAALSLALLLMVAYCSSTSAAAVASEPATADVPETDYFDDAPTNDTCCDWVSAEWGECMCPMTSSPAQGTTVYQPKYTNSPAPNTDCTCYCCDAYAK